MFNLSRKALLGLALVAVVLLIASLAASFFPGWVLAVILGLYVVGAMLKQRSNPAV